MRREIGSEFWNAGPQRRDDVYLLSGRTALEFIIRDILKNHNINSVLLPSYCCHTMIEPFCRHGIQVRFYDVFCGNDGGLCADVPEIRKNEIFYYLTYFGFDRISGVYIEEIKKQAEIIIEDCTHAWLARERMECSDYSYASFRKWTGFSGIAIASKANGAFAEIPYERNDRYCKMRRQASAMKREFIETGVGDKQRFLSLFGEAEELLEADYIGYLPEDSAVFELMNFDVRQAKEIRRKNAFVLLEGLQDISNITLLYKELSEQDAPLFVPILVPQDRMGLRKYLIENSIYCPVHWPLSSYHEEISDRAKVLYEQELSLLCDQRYGAEDMNKIIECIRTYYKR